MSPNSPQDFNDLPTSWTLLARAHDEAQSLEERQTARQEIIERYLGVMQRYLAGALRREPRCQELVAELVSEFSLKVMQGKLQTASPAKGRFRDFLKMILSNLVKDHYRGRRRGAAPLGEFDPATEDDAIDDLAFNQEWQVQLMMRAMAALAAEEPEHGGTLYAVLKLRMDQQDWSAAVMAVHLSSKLGKPVDEPWVGRHLHAARRRLRELVRQEVRQSLENPTEDAVDEELADLGMLEYVRDRKR